MDYYRYILGRYLVHLGIAIMPRGRVRSELFERFQAWSIIVKATVAAKQ